MSPEAPPPAGRFSAKEYMAALGEWVYQDRTGTRQTVARQVGVTHLLRYEQLSEAANQLKGSRKTAAHRAAFWWILRQAFPWRIAYLWRRELDPVREIMSLPPEVFEKAVVSFFGWVRPSKDEAPDMTAEISPTTSSGSSAAASR